MNVLSRSAITVSKHVLKHVRYTSRISGQQATKSNMTKPLVIGLGVVGVPTAIYFGSRYAGVDTQTIKDYCNIAENKVTGQVSKPEVQESPVVVTESTQEPVENTGLSKVQELAIIAKIKNNWRQITNVEEMTENIALAAVSSNYKAILFIPDEYQTEQVLIKTINGIDGWFRNNDFMDFFVNLDRNKFTEKVWKAAVGNDPRCHTLIPDKFYTDDVYLAFASSVNNYNYYNNSYGRNSPNMVIKYRKGMKNSTYLSIIKNLPDWDYLREMDFVTSDICKYTFTDIMENHQGNKYEYLFNDLLKGKDIPEEFWEYLSKKGNKEKVKKYIPSNMYQKYFS